MSKVFVLDVRKRPLDPVHPGRARILLSTGQAAVIRRYPFTIILKQETPDTQPQALRLKIDPGGSTTGLAVVHDAMGEVVFAAEINHRGQRVRKALLDRRSLRHSRRCRKTRYRQARFSNRRRPEGWLPPSLESRVANVLAWVTRLCHLCPIRALSLELARFDTQALQNPAVSGVEYQNGELAGYEVREYLLEKWGRHCAYRGATDVPLQLEHIIPRSRGGSNRVSNLTLACRACNNRKGPRTAVEWGYPDVQARAKAPLMDAEAINTTRGALLHRLRQVGLPLETGSGGRTKFNRYWAGRRASKRVLQHHHVCGHKYKVSAIGIALYCSEAMATAIRSRKERHFLLTPDDQAPWSMCRFLDETRPRCPSQPRTRRTGPCAAGHGA